MVFPFSSLDNPAIHGLARKYTWRDNVLFVEGVEVPQSQMRAILTRCLEEQVRAISSIETCQGFQGVLGLLQLL